MSTKKGAELNSSRTDLKFRKLPKHVFSTGFHFSNLGQSGPGGSTQTSKLEMSILHEKKIEKYMNDKIRSTLT